MKIDNTTRVRGLALVAVLGILGYIGYEGAVELGITVESDNGGFIVGRRYNGLTLASVKSLLRMLESEVWSNPVRRRCKDITMNYGDRVLFEGTACPNWGAEMYHNRNNPPELPVPEKDQVTGKRPGGEQFR